MMCLSNVYMKTGEKEEAIMRDVARIEAEGRGFWLLSLFGEKKFIEGKIDSIHFTDGHFVMLKKEHNDG